MGGLTLGQESHVYLGGKQHYEDKVAGDKISGDKVLGDKIVNIYQPALNKPTGPPNLAPGLPVHYVPRPEELDSIRQILLGSERRVAIAALQGMGGLGKTTLAIAICHDQQVLETFPDGILWATLGPDADLASAQIAWGAALGEDLTGLPGSDARAARLRSLLHNKRCLLVIDDVWDARHLAAMQVGGTGCATLVTSRERKIALKAGRVCDLDVLQPNQAFDLLAEWAGGINDQEKSEAEELASRLGYLPLALTLAGAQRLDGRSWSSLLSAFRRAQGAELSALDLDDPKVRDESLALAFSLSVDRLDAEMRDRFALLGVFAGGRESPFESQAVAAVWQVTADEAIAMLGRLVRAALVNMVDGNYHLHLLIRDYAYARLDEATRLETIGRHRKFYLDVARQSSVYWQAAESALPQMRLAWSRIAKDDLHELFIWPEAATVFLSRRGLWADYEAWTSAAWQAARTMGNRQAEAWCLNWLGMMEDALGSTDNAIQEYQSSLEIMQNIGNGAGIAAVKTNLGNSYYKRGGLDQALSEFRECLTLWRQLGFVDKAAEAINNIGQIHQYRGELDEALRRYETSLTYYRQLGKLAGQAVSLNNIGQILEQRKDLDQARNRYIESREIMRQLGNRRGEAVSLQNIGSTYYQQGDSDQALAYHQTSLSIYRSIGDQRGEAAVINNIGAVYYRQRDFPKALNSFNDALAIRCNIDDRPGQADTLWNIGVVFAESDNKVEARKNLTEARDLYRAMGMPQAMEVQDWLDHIESSPRG